jgi:hypothetical protein
MYWEEDHIAISWTTCWCCEADEERTEEMPRLGGRDFDFQIST